MDASYVGRIGQWDHGLEAEGIVNYEDGCKLEEEDDEKYEDDEKEEDDERTEDNKKDEDDEKDEDERAGKGPAASGP